MGLYTRYGPLLSVESKRSTMMPFFLPPILVTGFISWVWVLASLSGLCNWRSFCSHEIFSQAVLPANDKTKRFMIRLFCMRKQAEAFASAQATVELIDCECICSSSWWYPPYPCKEHRPNWIGIPWPLSVVVQFMQTSAHNFCGKAGCGSGRGEPQPRLSPGLLRALHATSDHSRLTTHRHHPPTDPAPSPEPNVPACPN